MPEPATKPMDRNELQPCSLCGKGVLHTGSPVFYELTVASCVADMRSIQQQHGLEVMMGKAAPLAALLAPSTTVAHRMPASRHLLCSDCAEVESPPLRFLGDANA